MATEISDAGDGQVFVDYVTNYRHDVICIFTIRMPGAATVYFLAMTDKDYKGRSKEGLARYLLDHVRSATVVRTFEFPNEARA
jgi:hypothetical protein